MYRILSDIYSILELDRILNWSAVDISPRMLGTAAPMIQRLVLCDEILVERKQAHRWVGPTLALFPEVIKAIPEPSDKQSEVGESIERLRAIPPTDEHSDSASGLSGFSARALRYLELAALLDVYYVPHPARQDVVEQANGARRVTAAEYLLSNFDSAIREHFEISLLSVDFEVPPVADYVAQYSRRTGAWMYQAIQEIRNSTNAESFRKWCRKVDEQLRQAQGRSQVRVLQPLKAELDSVTTRWVDDISEGISYRTRTVSLSKLPLVGKLFEVIGLDDIRLRDPVLAKNNRHLLFLSDIYGGQGATYHRSKENTESQRAVNADRAARLLRSIGPIYYTGKMGLPKR